uniref:(northern house mosquito) hypothetical protein n=1 Tax=Culex pipiens TaxID=7175 RepID=A0A8D7ZZ85_CULPI
MHRALVICGTSWRTTCTWLASSSPTASMSWTLSWTRRPTACTENFSGMRSATCGENCWMRSTGRTWYEILSGLVKNWRQRRFSISSFQRPRWHSGAVLWADFVTDW